MSASSTYTGLDCTDCLVALGAVLGEGLLRLGCALMDDGLGGEASSFVFTRMTTVAEVDIDSPYLYGKCVD